MSICITITDVDWERTKDVFSIFGTLVSAIGVALAAWVGFSGLATWRRQNKGTSDHDLSRRLLMDLYRLRDGVGHVRNPVMLGTEGGENEQDHDLDFAQKNHRAKVRAYEKRFSTVDEVRARLSTSLLESEAVWGDEVKLLFIPIFELLQELLLNVRTHLISANPDEDDDRRESYLTILSNRRDVLYESSEDGDDAFKSDFDAALCSIEDYLRPKLIN